MKPYSSDQDWDGDRESCAARRFDKRNDQRLPTFNGPRQRAGDDWVAHLRDLLVTPHVEAKPDRMVLLRTGEPIETAVAATRAEASELLRARMESKQ